MDYSEYQSKTVAVYGDHLAKEKNAIPAYERTLRTRPVTFTCTTCDKTVTQERYPGRTPLYCSETCQTQGTLAKKRKREQARREQTRKKKQTERQQCQN